MLHSASGTFNHITNRIFQQPTSQSTPKPTPKPTLKPTNVLTQNPTSQSTPKSTPKPTLKPTNVLTQNPTALPTGVPTSSRPVPVAKEVRLHSITGEQIHVFEIEIYSAGINVAKGKMATQSSTLNTFNATNAVDGKQKSFSCTNDKAYSWWKVDLGESYPIESVKIVNRWCGNPDDSKGCLCRLSHAILSLFDERGQWVATASIGDACGELQLTHSFSDGGS
jgi:hypothetical protein